MGINLSCDYKQERKIMESNTYKVLNRFDCCGKTMVTVIIEEKAALVMTEDEYNMIVYEIKRYEMFGI
jgi:hypothetical protein